ncbi:LacI family DNA-binding transcriptional regulator [Pseudomonas sp. M47T1]|uniref:LacI family DNA-binding transcriptional regulator n=1 Tax=Pseudomonas sp. M47T1 TaxID=1179778 RepID=UPI0005BB15AC|nr:LacI family DNA-binding transcriptional regulator [Pseudomonas sp. M47T1]
MSESARATRRPTMADVAREAGVSLSTVDRVLNLRADVRRDTAQRIVEAATRLGFHAKAVLEQRLLTHRPTVRLGFALHKSGVAFYQVLAQALSSAAAHYPHARIRVVIAYLDELDPARVAQRIAALRDQVDGLGVVAVDHPVIRQAVARLSDSGVAVVALISALSPAATAGYVGVDNRRMGRTAGWFVSRLANRPGPVAVLLSSQGFQCQELREFSFRSYLADQSPDWDLLATRLTLEDDAFAHGNTLDLLTGEPELAGLYVAGGGIAGVIQALGELKARQQRLPIVVCNEVTPLTAHALRDGLVHAVLSHPVAALAERTVDALVQAVTGARPVAGLVAIVPMQVDVQESL